MVQPLSISHAAGQGAWTHGFFFGPLAGWLSSFSSLCRDDDLEIPEKKLVLKQASHPSLTHNTSHHTQPLSTMPVDMCTRRPGGASQKEEEEVMPYSSKQASPPSLPHTLSPHTQHTPHTALEHHAGGHVHGSGPGALG